MAEFRKKPVVIEAIQWDGTDESAQEIAAAFDVDAQRLEFGNGVLDVVTLEGGHSASPGDWIIRGVQGELYPCKPDIFEATYEPARSEPPTEAGKPLGYVVVEHRTDGERIIRRVCSGFDGLLLTPHVAEELRDQRDTQAVHSNVYTVEPVGASPPPSGEPTEAESLIREPDFWQVQVEDDEHAYGFDTAEEAEKTAARERYALAEEYAADGEHTIPDVRVYPVWVGSPLRDPTPPESRPAAIPRITEFRQRVSHPRGDSEPDFIDDTEPTEAEGAEGAEHG